LYAAAVVVPTLIGSEIITFLSEGPTVEEVLVFHVSEQSQERLRRLLGLSRLGLLTPNEQAELDELQQIEHIMIMLKANIIAEKQNPYSCHW